MIPISTFERQQIQQALAYIPEPKRRGKKTRTLKDRGCLERRYEAFLVRQAMREAEERRPKSCNVQREVGS